MSSGSSDVEDQRFSRFAALQKNIKAMLYWRVAVNMNWWIYFKELKIDMFDALMTQKFQFL